MFPCCNRLVEICISSPAAAMTDPLSITASTITVLGILKTAKKSIDVLRELRVVPDIVLALDNELSDFQLCLEQLHQLSEKNLTDNSFHEKLQKFLRRCEPAVEETLDCIRNVSPPQRRGNSSEDNGVRYRWLGSRRLIKKHQEQLQKLHHELLLILSSVTVSQSIKTRVEIENVKILSEKTDERLHVLNANVEASKQVTVQGFTATGQSLLLLQEQLGYRLRGLRQTDIIMMDVSANQVFQDYGLNCGCPCHRDQTVALKQSPRSFDRFIGSLFLGYTALPIFRSQCVTTCRCPTPKTRIRLSYFFPAWWYWRAISAAMTLSDSGPELIIRMPKAVPTDWKLFGRAWNDEVDDLRQLLITKQAAPTDTDAFTGMTSLHQAASSGATESCQVLIHAGADAYAEDKSQQTPYLLAWSHILSNDISDEKTQKLRELFSDTSRLDEWALSTLHRVVLGLIVGTLDEETLVKTGSDINAIDNQRRTPLFWAAARKDLKNVDFLLRHGADVNIKSFDGQTAMHAAARSGSEDIVHKLVAYGADINLPDKHHKLPLHVAVARRWDIEYLLRLGSDFSALDCYLRPAMWYAAEKDSLYNVQALLRRSADLNPQDNAGWSPLHVCVERNQDVMAAFLIEHGADITLLTKDGRSVLHFAAEFGNMKTLQMLSCRSLRGIDPQTKSADGFTAQQITVRRLLAAEAAGSGLGEDWDQAFERLIRKVISSNLQAGQVEDMREDGEELFLDAQETISSV